METQDHAVRFNVSGVFIDADVSIPADATGIVLFVHGSGSSCHSLASTLESVAHLAADWFSSHLRLRGDTA